MAVARQNRTDHVQRFWSKVDRGEGCWEWKGKRDPYGYGAMQVDRRNKTAHRFSWEIHRGPIPHGLLVCHHCDNPCCVRPDHLFLGTARDNYLDSARKGRDRGRQNLVEGRKNGERYGKENLPLGRIHLWGPKGSKVTADQVREIRELRKGGFTLKRIALQFGITISAVWMIVHRWAWKHIE